MTGPRFLSVAHSTISLFLASNCSWRRSSFEKLLKGLRERGRLDNCRRIFCTSVDVLCRYSSTVSESLSSSGVQVGLVTYSLRVTESNSKSDSEKKSRNFSRRAKMEKLEMISALKLAVLGVTDGMKLKPLPSAIFCE